jgi:hypothetical protein
MLFEGKGDFRSFSLILCKHKIRCHKSGRFSMTAIDDELACQLILSFLATLVSFDLGPCFLDLCSSRHKNGKYTTLCLLNLRY